MRTPDGFLVCDWCHDTMPEHGVMVGGKEICEVCATRADVVEAVTTKLAAVLRGVAADSRGTGHQLRIDIVESVREVLADVEAAADREPTTIGGRR